MVEGSVKKGVGSQCLLFFLPVASWILPFFGFRLTAESASHHYERFQGSESGFLDAAGRREQFWQRGECFAPISGAIEGVCPATGIISLGSLFDLNWLHLVFCRFFRLKAVFCDLRPDFAMPRRDEYDFRGSGSTWASGISDLWLISGSRFSM